VATLPDGPFRKLGDDFGGRPRQWVDERLVVVERLGARLHSVALLDTVSGDQRDVLSSPQQSITNARVSPDGQWIAFDAAHPGGPPTVHVARLRIHEAIPQEDWCVIDRPSSHPFWSADGSILYYLPTTPSSELRNVVRASRFDATAGAPSGDPFTAFMSAEMVVPANITATAPVATRDGIIFVLGDFRGDVWMMDLEPGMRSSSIGPPGA
jgi:Tol biopolymer transport system component